MRIFAFLAGLATMALIVFMLAEVLRPNLAPNIPKASEADPMAVHHEGQIQPALPVFPGKRHKPEDI